MRSSRALSLLLALLLTACPGSSPVDPPAPFTDAGTGTPDGGSTSLTISTEALPAATVSQPYRVTLVASGGAPAYSWHLVQGALPPGLTLSGSSEITGTPSAPGAVSFTLEVRDAAGRSARGMFAIEVLGTGFDLTTSALPDAYLGSEYSLQLAASGGTLPYTWVLAGGSLPSGLRLGANGRFSGTPVGAGTFAVTLRVQDASGLSAQRDFSLSVFAPPSLSVTSLDLAAVGVPYSASLQATGGRAPLSFRIASGSLPPGLRLEGSSVLGTPTAAGTASFTIEVQDINDRAASAAFQLSVRGNLTVTPATLPDAYTDTVYGRGLSAAGGQPPYTWTLTQGSLPLGLRLLDSGALDGTSSTAGTVSFTVRVTDAERSTDTRQVSLTTYAPPSLASVPALSAYVGDTVSRAFSASGGKAPFRFTASGQLPPGLTLSEEGLLQGRPTQAGLFAFDVTAREANSRSASRPVSFTIHAPPSITTTSLPEGEPGRAYSLRLSVSGGRSPLSWTVASGSLPPGLSLASDGMLSGTPSALGDSSFTVRVTDGGGRTDSRSLSVTVYKPPTITTQSLSDALVGTPYAGSLTATGGRAPLTWSHTGSLPAGLSLSSSGVFSGTPTVTGSLSFTVTVRDAAGRQDSRSLSLTVRGASASLTVGHWNLEWFGAPNQGPPNSSSDGGTTDDLQIAHARDILGDAGVNVWGLVEMVDSQDFATLKAQLPGYSGFLANDAAFVPGGDYWYSPGEQKPGILYDSTLTFRGAQLILTAQAADFGGRPPLRVDFTQRIQGTEVSLAVIVVHMKAFEDEVAYGQRQRSGAALKHYLDTGMASERVLVIGDWNDDVDRSISRGDDGTYRVSPFESFVLDSSQYTFITRPLSLAGERTTVVYREAIDHTLATNEMAAEYLSGTVRVLRPDSWIPDYGNIVSDHYPVVSRYALGGGGSPNPLPAPVLLINEVLANEPAFDGGVGDTDHEFVEVVNAGTSSADLSGWSLWDSAVVRHVFPSGTSLAPGHAFVVFGGPRGFPAGAPNTLPASTGQLGLNNDADTPNLRAPDGGVVDSVSYTSTVDRVSLNRMPDAVPDAGFFVHTTLNPGLLSSPGRRADGGTF
ncbi:putative Ig domain-containing protein [Pyxidicoccus sp. 3LFB2]